MLGSVALYVLVAFVAGRLVVCHASDELSVLLAKIGSSRPNGADPKFDCAWRVFAYEYAQSIQPRIPSDTSKAKQLFDALELGVLCGQTYVAGTTAASVFGATCPPSASIRVFVNARNGSDANDGTVARPLKTLASAVAATRTGRTSPATACILLASGVYHLASTIRLGPEDSGLSIVGAQAATLSGGTLVEDVQWRTGPRGSVVADLAAYALPHGVPAMQYGDALERQRATRARYPNANPELDTFPMGYVTQKVRTHTRMVSDGMEPSAGVRRLNGLRRRSTASHATRRSSAALV
jgi:hypothetical protein